MYYLVMKPALYVALKESSDNVVSPTNFTMENEILVLNSGPLPHMLAAVTVIV